MLALKSLCSNPLRLKVRTFGDRYMYMDRWGKSQKPSRGALTSGRIAAAEKIRVGLVDIVSILNL